MKTHVKLGDPLDPITTVGPLSMEKQVHNLTAQVEKSVAKGARVLFGNLGFKMQQGELASGFYFHPMVIENITKEQPAYCEELFGPVFSLFRFRDSLEAIELANATSYGLSASIFTRDLEKGQRKAR